MATQTVVVLITAPDAEQAGRIARQLVDEGLAACVSVVPQVRSIYRWEGRVEEGAECLMLAKTREDAFEALRARVVALHPYQCPEIVALPIAEGHAPYLEWLRTSVA
jgi:periplasmic divalent cation tolerance protein